MKAKDTEELLETFELSLHRNLDVEKLSMEIVTKAKTDDYPELKGFDLQAERKQVHKEKIEAPLLAAQKFAEENRESFVSARFYHEVLFSIFSSTQHKSKELMILYKQLDEISVRSYFAIHGHCLMYDVILFGALWTCYMNDMNVLPNT